MRGIALAALFAMAGNAASAAVVFQEDFEGSSDSNVVDAQGYDGVNGFEGDMLRNTSTAGSFVVNLGDLGEHSELVISFDLALIDSWDGGQPRTCCDSDDLIGPDFFNVVLDGASILKTSNGDPISDELENVIRGPYGFNPEFDDLAATVSLTASHTSSNATILFFADGAGYQGQNDESWAIDNLVISTSGGGGGVNVVPLSSSMTLMLSALGLGALGVRRRQR